MKIENLPLYQSLNSTWRYSQHYGSASRVVMLIAIVILCLSAGAFASTLYHFTIYDIVPAESLLEASGILIIVSLLVIAGDLARHWLAKFLS